MPIGDKDIGEKGIRATKISGLLNPNPWTKTLYVSSTHTRARDENSDGRDKYHPLATIAGALSLCVAGDMIIVAPGHAETIDAAGDITVSLADITIVGIGRGQRKPKITFSTSTAGSFLISGAGVRIENLHFVTNIASLVLMLSITGADCEIIDCEISETGSGTCLDAITATAAADRLTVSGLKAVQATAGGQSCVNFLGDDTVITGCDLSGDYAVGVLENGAAATNVLFENNKLTNDNTADACIITHASTTGHVADNEYHNVDGWGKTLWVNSSHTNSSDAGNLARNKYQPLDSLVYALTQAAANDTIIVGEGHTEEIESAGAITVSLANLRIIGLGAGDQKPKITFSTSDATTFLISGNGVRVENIHFVTNMATLVTFLSITGTDCEIINCKMSETGSGTCVDGITAAATADRLRVTGLKAVLGTSDNTSIIQFQGDDTVIEDCDLYGDCAAGAIENVTTAVTGMLITRNHIETLNAADLGIATVATSTGWISHNNVRIATDAQTTWIDEEDANLAENWGVNVDGETGVLIGTPSA